MKRICVFCGAKAGNSPEFANHARLLGGAIANGGLELVYGGARVGLMGQVADAVLQAGGSVIGIIPEGIISREIIHTGVKDLRRVGSMHERKALMEKLSDAFVIMPGGIGTLDEFFEIWTWAQLGIHRKPIGILNIGGFYDLLLDFIDKRVIPEGFVETKSRAVLCIENDSERLVSRLREFQMPDIKRSLLRSES